MTIKQLCTCALRVGVLTIAVATVQSRPVSAQTSTPKSIINVKTGAAITLPAGGAMAAIATKPWTLAPSQTWVLFATGASLGPPFRIEPGTNASLALEPLGDLPGANSAPINGFPVILNPVNSTTPTVFRTWDERFVQAAGGTFVMWHNRGTNECLKDFGQYPTGGQLVESTCDLNDLGQLWAIFNNNLGTWDTTP
jgi:hypothetical protein